MKARRLGAALALLLAFSAARLDARDGDASGLSLGQRLFTGLPRAVVVVDPLAYVGLDTGLAIFDVSGGAAPALVSNLYLPSPAFDVAVAGGIVYVADGEAGLVVVDATDPSSPSIVATLPMASAHGVAVSGGLACLTEAQDGTSPVHGLRIVDVSTPAAPVALGFAPLPNGGLDVVVSGTTAYVAVGSDLGGSAHGLAIVDFSSPSAPSAIGFLDTGLAVNGVAIEGSVAYLAAGFPFVGAFATVDVSAPATPAQLSWTQLGDAAMGVSVKGGIAHVAARALGVVTFDVTSPSSVAAVDALPTGRESWAIDARGDVAFVGERSSNGSAGFTTVDTPPLPDCMVETSSTPFAETLDVAAAPGLALVLHRDGLSIFDTSVLGPAVLLSTWSPPGADLSSLTVDGDLAAIGEADAVRLVDLADPSSPVERGSLTVASGVVVDLDLDGGILHVVDGLGLETFDVSDPARPTARGAWRSSEWCAAVSVSAGNAFLAAGTHLQVLDVSNPAAPSLTGEIDLGAPVYAVAVDGNLAALAGLVDLVDLVDVSDPTTPQLLGQLPGGPAFGITLQGPHAHVALGEAGVAVVDVSDPTMPAVTASYDTSGTVVSVAPSGADLLVAATDAQDWILRCDACIAGCGAVADVLPMNPAVCEGTPVPLDGSASTVTGCPGAAAYQWFEDGTPIPGADQPTYVAPGTLAPGDHDFTLDVSCAALPGCGSSITTTVQVAPDTFPVIDVASLRVHKSAAGEAVLTWMITSGSGLTNVHRSQVARDVSDPNIDATTLVGVPAAAIWTNTLDLNPYSCLFFKVYGRRSCSGRSDVP